MCCSDECLDYTEPRKFEETRSIDEFLANYKHEMMSIFDFLSSLDDVPETYMQANFVQFPHRALSTSSMSSKRSYLHFSQPSPSLKNQDKQKIVSLSQSASSDESIDESCKRARNLTPAEAREEQKRCKNREYQRRFRERRRLLEYQRFARPSL